MWCSWNGLWVCAPHPWCRDPRWRLCHQRDPRQGSRRCGWSARMSSARTELCWWYFQGSPEEGNRQKEEDSCSLGLSFKFRLCWYSGASLLHNFAVCDREKEISWRSCRSTRSLTGICPLRSAKLQKGGVLKEWGPMIQHSMEYRTRYSVQYYCIRSVQMGNDFVFPYGWYSV